MAWVALLVAVLMTLGAWRLVFPHPPSRLHRWLDRWLDRWLRRRLWRWLGPPLNRLRGRTRPSDSPDPFDALTLQTRLAVVAQQIRQLEADPSVYARAHRLEAARAAYDDLLEGACDLAGVPVPDKPARDDPAGDDSERWREEQELVERGWTW